MFRYARHRIVEWPVTVNVPQDGGTVKPFEINMRYRLLDSDERDAMKDFASDADGIDFLVAHIEGWRDGDIGDEQGQAIPYSEDNLRALLKLPYFERPVSLGLLQASQGAPAKNS